MQFDRIISVRNNRTVFRDGELCIKVLEDDFPASFVLSEATNMVAAAEAGLNVPKLREVNLHGNKRLITYDYIVGSPILCSDRDDADFRAQRLNLLIDAQLSINGTRCPECIRNPRTVPNFAAQVLHVRRTMNRTQRISFKLLLTAVNMRLLPGISFVTAGLNPKMSFYLQAASFMLSTGRTLTRELRNPMLQYAALCFGSHAENKRHANISSSI